MSVHKRGNQKHFQANPDAPIFSELCGIAQKTFGVAAPLREALMPLDEQIQTAFVYGSVAKKSDTASSDIDIMLISDKLAYADVMQALDAVQIRLGRSINPTLYSTVVIVAASEFQSLTRPQGSLVEFLRRSPLRGVELKLERSRDAGRKVRL